MTQDYAPSYPHNAVGWGRAEDFLDDKGQKGAWMPLWLSGFIASGRLASAVLPI